MKNKFNSKVPLLFAPVSMLFRRNFKIYWAVTIGQTSYFTVAANEVSVEWLKHENQHKQQWKRLGFIGFIVLYSYYIICFGYTDNPFEVEARRVECEQR